MDKIVLGFYKKLMLHFHIVVGHTTTVFQNTLKKESSITITIVQPLKTFKTNVMYRAPVTLGSNC